MLEFWGLGVGPTKLIPLMHEWGERFDLQLTQLFAWEFDVFQVALGTKRLCESTKIVHPTPIFRHKRNFLQVLLTVVQTTYASLPLLGEFDLHLSVTKAHRSKSWHIMHQKLQVKKVESHQLCWKYQLEDPQVDSKEYIMASSAKIYFNVYYTRIKVWGLCNEVHYTLRKNGIYWRFLTQVKQAKKDEI